MSTGWDKDKSIEKGIESSTETATGLATGGASAVIVFLITKIFPSFPLELAIPIGAGVATITSGLFGYYRNKRKHT